MFPMAIFHLNVGIVSRKTGRSAVAAAAYRAGENIVNERDGVRHDFTHKTGVIYTEIMLPQNAPKDFQDRAVLWNAVEKAEKRCDSQTAREIDIALPVEFDRQEQIEIMREYIGENFVKHGMCADFALHDKKDGNPHAHVMLTMREVRETGFGGKNRDWNKTEFVEQWRENWALICNDKFQEKGLDIRIDHRTLEAQGIDREPTTHIGAAAKAMARRGIDTDSMKKHREISEYNKSLTPEIIAESMGNLRKRYAVLDKEITALSQENVDIQREIKILNFKSEQIDERAKYIQSIKERLEQLKSEPRTGKTPHNEQIKRLEKSVEQAEDTFKRKYFIDPDQATTEITRIEYKIKDMEIMRLRTEDKLSPLIEDKNAIVLDYQRQKLLAEISPNAREIQEKLKPYPPSKRELNTVNERNFEEILKTVRPRQAQKMIEHREREKVRDLSQIRRYVR
jgi:hypothetical protein